MKGVAPTPILSGLVLPDPVSASLVVALCTFHTQGGTIQPRTGAKWQQLKREEFEGSVYGQQMALAIMLL